MRLEGKTAIVTGGGGEIAGQIIEIGSEILIRHR